MVRFGVCCCFRDVVIRFRTTTAAAMLRLPRARRLERLAELALTNAASLREAIRYCASQGIGCFRINSQILPLLTHPEAGYAAGDLPDAESIIAAFVACGRAAARAGVRLTFHPDQFVVLSSPKEQVIRSSIAELEYQAMVAEWVGADVITLHGGGAYSDKKSALDRLRRNLSRLSAGARSRIALENDDRVFTPSDLLPMCESEGVPFVYDVHHHRCLPDGLSTDEVTRWSIATWKREPLFHVSSPQGGWRAANPRVHAEFVRVSDFPECWKVLQATVEVEAKAKEAAVLRLIRAVAARPSVASGPCAARTTMGGLA